MNRSLYGPEALLRVSFAQINPVERMTRLRLLVLAPDCNPEGITNPLIGYCHAKALAELHDVTLVTNPSSEDTLRRADAPFRAIEVIRMPRVEYVEDRVRRMFKYNFRNQVLTAFSVPFSMIFEWGAWRQLKRRIVAGEFDAVLRLLPISTVTPSPMAFFLRKGPIPFVVGPINGGLPWPPGFSQADNQKQWISPLRGLYRLVPFAGSTFRCSAAIIAGSSNTCSELVAYREKVFYVPENGLSSWIFSGDLRGSRKSGKLELIFLGALVPYKACDLALRAAAPLLRADLARFTVVGDGPERDRLEELTRSLGVEKGVSFLGSVSHSEAMKLMGLADVLVFPSVHEFGGAVVIEALAAGAVPIVADFGGPGDTVHPDVGFKVPLRNESDVVSHIESILTLLAHDRALLESLRERGMSYARENFSWNAKAQVVTRIIGWAAGKGPKPQLPPPTALSEGVGSSL